MPYGMVGSIFQGVANFASSLVNKSSQDQANRQNYSAQQQNYKLQKETLDWNKAQADLAQRNQAIAWGREDDAVQRRVADLKAAGINPLLAAGSAAQSSGPISPASVSAPTSAPQKQVAPFPGVSGIDQVLSAMQMQKDFARKDAEIELLRRQADRTVAEIDESHARTTGTTLSNQLAAYENGLAEKRWEIEAKRAGITDQQIKQIAEQVSTSALNRAIDKYNFDIYQKAGVATDAPATVKTGASVYNAGLPLLERVLSSVSSYVNTSKGVQSERGRSSPLKADIVRRESVNANEENYRRGRISWSEYQRERARLRY